MISTSTPNSEASNSQSAEPTSLFMVSISPRVIALAMISDAGTPIFSARLATVMSP